MPAPAPAISESCTSVEPPSKQTNAAMSRFLNFSLSIVTARIAVKIILDWLRTWYDAADMRPRAAKYSTFCAA